MTETVETLSSGQRKQSAFHASWPNVPQAEVQENETREMKYLQNSQPF